MPHTNRLTPEQLRIGNMVRVTFDKEETGYGKDYNGEIEAIQRNKVLIKGDLHWQPIEAMKPIPLTPDVLEACGFRVDTKSQYGGFVYPISDEKDEDIRIVHDILIEWNWPLYGNTPVLVPYVHSLQNLIHALTGTDLPINSSLKNK